MFKIKNIDLQIKNARVSINLNHKSKKILIAFTTEIW